jgi:acetylornithine deacetylase/succinyl-diaminopimelate desuccinylase-like protein
MVRRVRHGVWLLLWLGLWAQGAAAQSALTPAQRLAREIFEELIEINTTDSSGDNTRAAEAMAKRLLAAGFAEADVQVLAPAPRKGNLVARLRGANAGRKPLLLLAHLDVVEARREDWSLDPFTFTEQEGYFYGRGTTDDKPMAAIWIANLIRFKQEGVVPERDIIVALTADEEGGDHNGVAWLLQNHKPLVDAAYALNEGGGGQIKSGRKLLNAVQASEKVFQSFHVEATNKGGHSSRPEPDNAIYRVAAALTRIAAFTFPTNLNEVTRTYFERMSGIETGPLAQDMKGVAQPRADAAAVTRLSQQAYYNALMRTTCVATLIEGGHAENALPQLARATVNCRILPGEDPAVVLSTLQRVVADDQVKVTPVAAAKPSPPSPLSGEVMGPIERITREMWPGVPVVPVMSTGATDGLYLRQEGIPVYGVSGLFGDIDDNRAHGRDERMAVSSFYEGLDFLYRLMKALALPST